MSVIAEITIGKRRIIEFFLDPLMTHADSSLEVRLLTERVDDGK